MEAVIDLRVRFKEEPSSAVLGGLNWASVGDYPSRESIEEQQVAFGGPEPALSSRLIGYRFTSDDKKRILQARTNGFTFSRLPQYDRWGPFCQEARELWRLYVQSTRPEQVTRVAVRYINRLELPVPIPDFSAYLRNVPEVSPDLPQGLSGFLLQLKIPQTDLPNGMLVINEGLLRSEDPRRAAVLLDIDVFHSAELAPDADGVWDALEGLHDRKNQAFEASITERTRELIR